MWMVQNGIDSEVPQIKILERLEGASFDMTPALNNYFIDGSSAEGQEIMNDTDKMTLLLCYVYYILYVFSMDHYIDGYAVEAYQQIGLDNSVERPSFGWIDMGAAGRAITITPKRIPMTWKKKWPTLAIPVALSGSSCAPLRRLWFLERLRGAAESSWRVLEKVQLPTCSPIQENKMDIRQLRDQRVYG